MATNVRIYQGNQIGGCVTVITYSENNKTIRLMVDYGQSLPGSEIPDDFEYDWANEPVDGVFFTHYHGDHTGRFTEIPPEIKLYMGATARKVMINIQTALSFSPNPDVSESAKRALSILNDDNRIIEITENKPVVFELAYNANYSPKCNTVTITGYSLDHSAYDAYMYLIETPDKSILHTGDFRGHGYRGEALIPTIQKHVRRFGKRAVDILVTEGTMMNRSSEKIIAEKDLRREAEKQIQKHKYVFLICSSTNLDSLASFYSAAHMIRPYRMRMYTYSEYVCQQLNTFTETAGKRSTLYQFKHVHPLNLEKELHHKNWNKPIKQKELMREHGFLAIIKPENFCEKYIDEFLDLKPIIIYSMWDGYLNPQHKAYKADWDSFLKRQEAKGVEVKHLHTSGHADAAMIAEVIETVNPMEAIYPIHTENADGFYALNISDTLKNKINIASDK